MDDIAEFADASEGEDIDLEEGHGVAQHWFENCYLPPPGPVADDDDNVSVASFTSAILDDDDDFVDALEYEEAEEAF